MAGLFRPRTFARDAEHRCYGVVPKGNDRGPMLPAWTGDVHDTMDEDVGRDMVSHWHLGNLK